MDQNERKSDAILDAALPVFVRHGFRKASMADIARAARMSRAALYLSFSSKEVLFRAGSARAHARTMRNVEAALAAFQRELVAPFAGSADAAELFDANMTLARDITLGARTRLVALLAQALSDADASGAISLQLLKAKPADVAGMIVAAIEGIKDAKDSGQSLEEGTRLFMRLLRAAL